MREYRYVGPKALLEVSGESSTRCFIQNQADVLSWLKRTHQELDSEGKVTATFIVDTGERLWIADRHSEHVACAACGPVLSAGEMTFRVRGTRVEVSAVTNQSTGFCPEPESWPSVAKALDDIGLAHPGAFISPFHFRRCGACDSINIVKEEQFVCSVCDAQLDEEWNFGGD